MVFHGRTFSTAIILKLRRHDIDVVYKSESGHILGKVRRVGEHMLHLVPSGSYGFWTRAPTVVVRTSTFLGAPGME